MAKASNSNQTGSNQNQNQTLANQSSSNSGVVAIHSISANGAPVSSSSSAARSGHSGSGSPDGPLAATAARSSPAASPAQSPPFATHSLPGASASASSSLGNQQSQHFHFPPAASASTSQASSGPAHQNPHPHEHKPVSKSHSLNQSQDPQARPAAATDGHCSSEPPGPVRAVGAPISPAIAPVAASGQAPTPVRSSGRKWAASHSRAAILKPAEFQVLQALLATPRDAAKAAFGDADASVPVVLDDSAVLTMQSLAPLLSSVHMRKHRPPLADVLRIGAPTAPTPNHAAADAYAETGAEATGDKQVLNTSEATTSRTPSNHGNLMHNPEYFATVRRVQRPSRPSIAPPPPAADLHAVKRLLTDWQTQLNARRMPTRPAASGTNTHTGSSPPQHAHTTRARSADFFSDCSGSSSPAQPQPDASAGVSGSSRLESSDPHASSRMPKQQSSSSRNSPEEDEAADDECAPPPPPHSHQSSPPERHLKQPLGVSPSSSNSSRGPSGNGAARVNANVNGIGVGAAGSRMAMSMSTGIGAGAEAGVGALSSASGLTSSVAVLDAERDVVSIGAAARAFRLASASQSLHIYSGAGALHAHLHAALGHHQSSDGDPMLTSGSGTTGTRSIYDTLRHASHLVTDEPLPDGTVMYTVQCTLYTTEL